MYNFIMAAKDATEWFTQAEYDLETAESNFDSGRYIHAVFIATWPWRKP